MDNTPLYGYMKNTSSSFLEELGGNNSMNHPASMMGPGNINRDCHPASGQMSMHGYGRPDSGSSGYMPTNMNPMQNMPMGSSGTYAPIPQQYYEPGPYMGSNKLPHANMVSQSIPGMNTNSVSRNNWSSHPSYQNLPPSCGNPSIYHHPHHSSGGNNPVMAVNNASSVQYPQSNSSATVGWHQQHPANNPNNAANNTLYYSHSQHPSMQYVPGTNVPSYLPGVNIPTQNYPPMMYRPQPGQSTALSSEGLTSSQQYNPSVGNTHSNNTFVPQDIHCGSQSQNIPGTGGSQQPGTVSHPPHPLSSSSLKDSQLHHGCAATTPSAQPKASNNHPNPLQQLSVMTSQISYSTTPVSHSSQQQQQQLHQSNLPPQMSNETVNNCQLGPNIISCNSEAISSNVVMNHSSNTSAATTVVGGGLQLNNDNESPSCVNVGAGGGFSTLSKPSSSLKSTLMDNKRIESDIDTPEDISSTLTMDVIAEESPPSYVEDTGLNTPPAIPMEADDSVTTIRYSSGVEFTPPSKFAETVPHVSPPAPLPSVSSSSSSSSSNPDVSSPSHPPLTSSESCEMDTVNNFAENVSPPELLSEVDKMEETTTEMDSSPQIEQIIKKKTKKRKRSPSPEIIEEQIISTPEVPSPTPEISQMAQSESVLSKSNEASPLTETIVENLEETEIMPTNNGIFNGRIFSHESSAVSPKEKEAESEIDFRLSQFDEEEPFLPAPPAKRPRGNASKNKSSHKKKLPATHVNRKKIKGGFVGSQRSYYGEGGDSDFEESKDFNVPGSSRRSAAGEETVTSDSESLGIVNGTTKPPAIVAAKAKKRRSSRAAASNKRYNEDTALAFSGDEAGNDNNDDTTSSQDATSLYNTPSSTTTHDNGKLRVISTQDHRGEEVVEIENKVVEKILGRRMGKRPIAKSLTTNSNNKEEEDDNNDNDNHNSVQEEELEEDVEEFYLKYKGYSYLHCEWKPMDEIEDPRILAKVKRYRAKHGQLEEDEDEELFNPDYVEVDRVLDMRVLQEEIEIQIDPTETTDNGSEISTEDMENPSTPTTTRKVTTIDVTYYLVKWRSLPYEEATWELAQDVDPIKVKEHMRWRDLHEVSKSFSSSIYGPGERPKPSEWNASEQSRRVTIDRVYRNANQLRAYQVEGVNWLTFCWYHRRNCILADEMGLGKTVQSIAFLSEVFATGVRGPFLVLVPLSTIGNWQREFENWTDMNVLVYHGSALSRQMIQQYDMFYGSNGPPFTISSSSSNSISRRSQAQLQQWTKQCKFHALITTYEVLMNDIDFFSRFLWRVAIIDEAHRLKNKKCKLHEGLSYLDLEHRVLLTGTPLQNNVEELFSLLNFLNPIKFPSAETFLNEFGDLKTEDQVAKLQQLLKPMMLRRLKEDVEKSIAPKEETIIEVELTNIQKRYYRAILEKNYKYLCKGATHSNAPNLINTMMELRKCCNHPYLIRHAEENIMNEMREMQIQFQREREDNKIKNPPPPPPPPPTLPPPAPTPTAVVEKENNKSSLVKSSISDDVTIIPVNDDDDVIKSSLSENIATSEIVVPNENGIVSNNKNITNSTTIATTTASSSSTSTSQSIIDMNYSELQLHTLIYASGKLVLVHKLLPRLKQEGHKVLIFSQMTRVLDILEDYLLSQRFLYERLDGGITGEKRQEAIDRFCNDPSKFIFILCTKAGGLGINLTAADVVIIYDSDWNPQNDLQAQARCHRIGQSKMVKVYRLITRNTYEREMFDKASMKLGLDKAVLQSMGSKETKKAQPTKKEVEELLKKGAYGALMDDDRAGEDFCEEDIDNILQRRSHVVQIEGAPASGTTASVLLGQSTFSKASFSVSDNRNDIDIDDPNFWSKWAKDAGLDEQSMLAEQNLIVDEPRQRRQTNRYVADSGYDYVDKESATAVSIANNNAANNNDHANNLNGQNMTSACGLATSGRISDDDSSFMGGDDGRGDDAGSGLMPGGLAGLGDLDADIRIGAQAQGAIIDGEIIDRVDMFKLEKGLLTWGWSRWEEILNNTPLKCSNTLTTEQVAKLCRAIIHYAVRNYNGDPRIASFVAHLLRPGAQQDMQRHLGMSAPVARGRRCRTGVGGPSTSAMDNNPKPITEVPDDIDGLKDIELPPPDEHVKLISDGFKKHLKRASNRLLHRVQALYFLQHYILGSGGHADKIISGASNTECRLLHSDSVNSTSGPSNIYRRLDSMEKPATWWDREADECLLLGAFKHGCEKYESMRADPQLCFYHKCGPPFGAAANSSLLPTTTTTIEVTGDAGDEPMETKTEVDEEDVANAEEEVACKRLKEENHPDEEEEESNKKSTTGDDVDECKMECSTTTLLNQTDLNNTNYFSFPSTTDLNSRFRRLIAFFQRIKHQEDNDAQKSKRRAAAAPVVQAIPTLTMMPTIDSRWLTPRDIKWSRREEADFYRVVCTFGVERMADSRGHFTGVGPNASNALYAWENFRNFSSITKKSDAALGAYYEAFRYMCRSVTNQLDLDERPPNDVKVSAISSERAAKCLHKIDLLCRVREEALGHPLLEERLQLCQRSPDLPDWWLPVVHDRDLLRGVAKYGLGHCETNILLDPDFNFCQTVQMIEQKVLFDAQIHQKIAAYGIGGSASSLAAGVAIEMKNILERKNSPTDEQQTDLIDSSSLPVQAETMTTTQVEEVKELVENMEMETTNVESSVLIEAKEVKDDDKEGENVENVETEADTAVISSEGKSPADECAPSDSVDNHSAETPSVPLVEDVLTVQPTTPTATQPSLLPPAPPSSQEESEKSELPWQRTPNISALINCAIAWPKDRTILNRIEAVIHCVEHGEWPYPRRYLGQPPVQPQSTSAMWNASTVLPTNTVPGITGMPSTSALTGPSPVLNTPVGQTTNLDVNDYSVPMANRTSGLDHILSSHDILVIGEQHAAEATAAANKYLMDNSKKPSSSSKVDMITEANTAAAAAAATDMVNMTMEQQLMAQFLQSIGLENFASSYGQTTASTGNPISSSSAVTTMATSTTSSLPTTTSSTPGGRVSSRGRGRSKGNATTATPSRNTSQMPSTSSATNNKAGPSGSSGGGGGSTSSVAPELINDNETMAAMNALLMQYMTAFAGYNTNNNPTVSVEEQQQQFLLMRSLLASLSMQQQTICNDSATINKQQQQQQQQQAMELLLASATASNINQPAALTPSKPQQQQQQQAPQQQQQQQQQTNRRGRKKKMEKASNNMASSSNSKVFGSNERPTGTPVASSSSSFGTAQNQMDAATSAWLTSALSALGVPSLTNPLETSTEMSSSSLPTTTSKTSKGNHKNQSESDKLPVMKGSSSNESGAKWDVVVPVMNLATNTLLDTADQAPKRRHLEQWLRDHPDFVPYSIEQVDQDIWNRVSRSRGDEACNLVELVQYHHYMSMMQAALTSGSLSVDSSLSQLQQQQQQAATALAMNQMLAQFIGMSQQPGSQTSALDATLSSIYAAASLNSIMANATNAETFDETQKSISKSHNQLESSASASRQTREKETVVNKRDVDSECSTPKRGTSRGDKVSTSRKTSISPGRSVATPRQSASASTPVPPQPPPQPPATATTSATPAMPASATDLTDALQQTMSVEDYNNYVAYQMMYALAYSNPLLYNQMLASATGVPATPSSSAANTEQSTSAATDQLLRDFSSYQQARSLTSASFGDIAGISGSLPTPSKSPSAAASAAAVSATATQRQSNPASSDESSAVLDLSSKKVS